MRRRPVGFFSPLGWPRPPPEMRRGEPEPAKSAKNAPLRAWECSGGHPRLFPFCAPPAPRICRIWADERTLPAPPRTFPPPGGGDRGGVRPGFRPPPAAGHSSVARFPALPFGGGSGGAVGAASDGGGLLAQQAKRRAIFPRRLLPRAPRPAETMISTRQPLPSGLDVLDVIGRYSVLAEIRKTHSAFTAPGGGFFDSSSDCCLAAVGFPQRPRRARRMCLDWPWVGDLRPNCAI